MELSNEPPSDSSFYRYSVPGLLVAAGIFGGICGLLLLEMFRSKLGSDGTLGGIGFFGLLSGPFHLGLLAAAVRPDISGRLAAAMSVICLIAAAPLMGEGIVCLIVIGPWMIVLTPIIGFFAGWLLRQWGWRGARGIGLVVALLLPAGMARMDLERRRGAPAEILEFGDSVVVDAPREVVWASIERLELDFAEMESPWVVRAMLPRPIAIRGGGAHPGAERRVLFSNGTVVATVTRAEAPSRFDIDLRIEDPGVEFFDHWTNLVDSTFELEELPGGRTRIVHRTRYQALCFPRWYFAPAEEYFGRALQLHLLEAYAGQFFPTDSRETEEPLRVAAR